ncbi:MAG: mismatch repair protein MutS domain protein [Crocinitomicaceae bacterium]|jgi:DNA mismatch repair protein MutS2|nr:mismatch repair protein MutS domain protein [Crocinitomicaceae bacterium]
MLFDEQSLKDLEFNTILNWLEAFAIGETARERIRQLTPNSKFDYIRAELDRLQEFHNIKTEGEPFPALDFDELKKELKILPVKNAVLEQEGFVRISRASLLVNAILHFFDKREKEYPMLSGLLSEVYFTKEIVDAIDKVFDRKGAIKDDASPELFLIRQKISVVRNQVNRNFDKEMRRLLKEGVLADTKEAFINERRVLAVVSTHKRKISGTVSGSSKTGSLTFIEPQINIELNNELEMLIDDERKEIYRILQALTRDIAGFFPLIYAYQDLLCEFDFISAKTKLALDLNCNLPSISDEPHIELIHAFHPILWKNNKISGKKTLPQSVTLNKFSRFLVISGPNAGGKSITLKTIGLIQIMLQSGLLVPCDPNSKLSFFQYILSDIGDNQSIENELSTYSYRLKRMKYFLEIANRRTLLLLDEFGTGSDPDLGGALAEVFFEHLYNKKSFGVITTHYGNIKLKADRLQNAINGCMLFDTETLEPLFRFSIGQPGSSFTFEVAQINGIPIELIEEAKTKVDEQKVNMDQLLSELQREKTYLERLNKEHVEAQQMAEEARLKHQESKRKIDAKLQQQAEFMETNSKFINGGKKLKTFIDRFQVKSRKKDINQPLMEEVRKYLLVEKSKIEESRLKEKLKNAVPQKENSKKKKAPKPEQDIHQRDKIQVGSTVKLIETKQSGTVEEINGNMLTVAFGFLRMKVERNKLSFVK